MSDRLEHAQTNAFCSMERMTPRLTLVRPTLVPVGINIIVRDTE